MSRRYAKYSKTPLSQTRREIERLLQEWGCKKVAFLDDYENQCCEIQFFWAHEDATMYAARFKIGLAPDPDLTANQAAGELRGRLRALFYWLRSAFAAIDVGVVGAEEVFLPWLVGSDGMTVAEALLPRIRELPTLPMRLLAAPKR